MVRSLACVSVAVAAVTAPALAFAPPSAQQTTAASIAEQQRTCLHMAPPGKSSRPNAEMEHCHRPHDVDLFHISLSHFLFIFVCTFQADGESREQAERRSATRNSPTIEAEATPAGEDMTHMSWKIAARS